MIERQRKPYGRRGTRFKRGYEKKTSQLSGGENGEEIFFRPALLRSILDLSWPKKEEIDRLTLVAIEEAVYALNS